MQEKKKNWLHYTDSEYNDTVDEWVFSDDHLTGKVLKGSDRAKMTQKAQALRLADGQPAKPGSLGNMRVMKYLLIRSQGETEMAYAERVALANYTPLFAVSCIALSGMLRAAEKAGGEVVRRPLKGQASVLGSFDDDETILGRIKDDADGSGTDYNSQVSMAGISLIAKRVIYAVVDGFMVDEDGEEIAPPRITLVQPEDVLDKTVDRRTGHLQSVKIKSHEDTRSSIKEEESLEPRWHVYYSWGVETWREEKPKVRGEDAKPVLEDTRLWAEPDISSDGEEVPSFYFYASKKRKRQVPPVIRVELPIFVNIGYLMAQVANKIFNSESALDFQLRMASFPSYLADVVNEEGELLSDLYEEVKKQFRSGSSVKPDKGNSKFDSPPVDGVEVKAQRVQEMIATYMQVFFQTYGAATIEQTATEVSWDIWSSVESFLTRFADAIDTFENQAFLFLEQIVSPEDPSEWGKTSVDRSKLNFAALGIQDRLEKIAKMTQPGEVLPVSPEDAAWLGERILAQAGRILEGADLERHNKYVKRVYDMRELEKFGDSIPEELRKSLGMPEKKDPPAIQVNPMDPPGPPATPVPPVNPVMDGS